jgi:1,4-alpha-glucan branching enzyme
MKDDDGDGTYSITVKLTPGSYQYKFVIDGQWTKDPYSPGDAPDGFGGRNGKFDVK